MWMDGWRGGGEREMARCVGKKKRERVCERDGRAMSKQSFASTPDSSSFFPLPHRRKGRWKEDGEGGEARLWELRCLLLSVERNVVRDSVDRDRAIDIFLRKWKFVCNDTKYEIYKLMYVCVLSLRWLGTKTCAEELWKEGEWKER